MGWDANESRPSGHGDPIKNLADEDMRLNRRQVLPDDGVAEEKAEHRPRVARRLEFEDDPLDLSRLIGSHVSPRSALRLFGRA